MHPGRWQAGVSEVAGAADLQAAVADDRDPRPR